MTIICYRDGIMAADSAVYAGNIRVGTTQKIVRRDDGSIAGASGTTSICQRFIAWFLSGGCGDFEPDDEDKDFIAIEMSAKGHVRRMEHDGKWFAINAPFSAIGFPQDFALGAMAAGSSAEDAVRLCLKWHDGCGGDVQVERLHG